MSGTKRPRRAVPARATQPASQGPREPRRPFGSGLFAGGASFLPSIPRSFGRGLLAVAASPVLLVVGLAVPLVAWLVVLGLGYEGPPAPLVDVLAPAPFSTIFDAGIGSSLLGLGVPFLVFTTSAFLLRAIVVGLVAGMIVDALETGRIGTYGLLRGVRAIPTVLVAQVLSFSLILASQASAQVLGPGIGTLAQVAALVGGLFLLGFAPAAAVRQGRGVAETVRRSGRAAMLPGSRQVAFCMLYFFAYFFVVRPIVIGTSSENTADPTLTSWVLVLGMNVVHLAFMAALAYRWIVAEPSVPEEPVRRREAASRRPAAPRGRRSAP